MSQQVEPNHSQIQKNCVAFLFIGSAQNFDNDYDRQNLIDSGISFQQLQKGADEMQLIREDRDALRYHAKSLQSKCEIVSFDSIISKKFLLKKSQVIDFIKENLLKYQSYDEINIHFDGPSIKYTGDWAFKNNNILKQEELLHIIVNSQFRNKLVIVSNSNFSNELVEQYNRATFDNYVCYFNSFLFISTCLREQQYHSFYQFYNYSCRNCCFVKQLENSHSADIRKIQLDSIDLSALVSPSNNLLNINNHQSNQHQCPSFRQSFNDCSTQMNTARNLINVSNNQILDSAEEKKSDEKVEDISYRQNKKQSILTPRMNQNIRNSIEIRSQDVSYEFLSTNHTFNNNNQSFKVLGNDQIKYFFSSTQAIKKISYQ